MAHPITETLQELDNAIRQRFDPLGFFEGPNGSFATGRVPAVAPQAHLCWRYAGLDEAGIEAAENSAGRYIPEPYKALLRHMNGARFLGVSLLGEIGGSVDRSGIGIGQPVSIRYQNIIGRPDYIPNGHLGIGAINGEWFSQGHLYLTTTGEVELYNARCDLIGKRWPSLVAFFNEEMNRRFTLYEPNGSKKSGAKHIPGDTEDWEQLAEAAKAKLRGDGFIKKIMNRLTPQ
ncbi:hypothetical protein NBRC116594_26710 [Shimia sp. NS0008-38b]|uniref:SMI1/KNR4 family protein n=1 Tax=Shimia sp. NS0008-38b TaxID=3127653 RepID=UPI0031073FAC